MQGLPYRSQARQTPIVIATSGLTVWKLLPIVAVIALLGLYASHRVELHCDRVAGSCTYVDSNVFSDASGPPVPVASLLSAFIDSGRKGSSRVTLRTKKGSVLLTNGRESTLGDDKRAMVSAVDAFVAGRGATLDVGYGSFVNAFVFVGPLGLLVLFLLVYAWRSMRLSFYRVERRVVLETHAIFGLFARGRELELKDVDAAVLESSSNRGSTTYRAALRLSNGEQIPLSVAYSSGSSGKEALVGRINAALAECRAA